MERGGRPAWATTSPEAERSIIVARKQGRVPPSSPNPSSSPPSDLKRAVRRLRRSTMDGALVSPHCSAELPNVRPIDAFAA